IKIVQQPLHARMCGFGEKDRRPVDPPPIVQLDEDEGDGEYDDDDDEEQDPLFVLHVSLWSHDGTEVRNMIATPGQSDPPKLTRILMGSLVVSPILLNNPDGVPGWYFSFPDLSIRTEGVYTLKFALMRFDFLSGEEGQQASTLVAEETSEPFTVFSAKKFPGMTESTELSKAFAKQGLKIPIRNDLRIRKNADKD
ncbi:MAG: velvet factor, partial [Podila humilis]